MDLFVARQPIFDRRRGVAGYELLFRAGLENAFPRGMDPDAASAQVINDTLLVFGFDALTAGKLAYVNVTNRVLNEGLYGVLPSRRTVIELLETVRPDQAAVEACRQAKKAGYSLALDDFVYRPEMDPLLRLADVVKVDFLATDAATRRVLPERLKPFRVKLLAEKVETWEEFEQARAEGYTYFQGYFFARPEIVARKDVPASKLVYVQFLRELQRAELDFDRLEQIIKQDVALSMKLLRYLNSAFFAWRSRVTSLKQAIVMLGERPFRQWASLVAVVGMAADRPSELAALCLSRGRFCELLGPKVKIRASDLELFLAGLLSFMDALMGRPLDEILREVGVSHVIEEALVGARASPLGKLVSLVTAYEAARWDEVGALTTALGLGEPAVASAYQEAADWARRALPS
jgi:EAL and modified HD-GYP domain-containing signal transduction protein